jgi:transcriptional regulator with XRE-family HTH domain
MWARDRECKGGVGKFCREREAKGWTHAELARRVRCQQQTIDKIERGLTEESRLLPRIALELGLPLDRIA